jgi:DNA-binding IclR family transcriptional regulator
MVNLGMVAVIINERGILMTTYKRIGAVKTTLDILKFLSDQKKPVTGKDVALAIDVPHGTCMCYLATLADSSIVCQTGECFELGMGMAAFWARYKANVEGKISRLTNELHQLEV